jgi:DNA primase
MPAKSWVSYAAVKDAVPIERVLERLSHPFTRKADGRIEATCPIHKGTHARQFKTTANGRGFKCFACGAKGNVLDLVAALEGAETREVALRLAEWFGLPRNSSAQPAQRNAVPSGNLRRGRTPAQGAHSKRV